MDCQSVGAEWTIEAVAGTSDVPGTKRRPAHQLLQRRIVWPSRRTDLLSSARTLAFGTSNKQ